MSGFEFTDALVRSHDGAMVPIVIIDKTGIARDGTNPTLMYGYGAYGIENTSPFFDKADLPWLERGGVLVWTGVRGGGEFGEEWHMGGFQRTKPNTWKDFIAVAEYLIAQRYTSPAHLGIESASAGGILLMNAVAERPDLFAAVVDRAGLNDPLRFETTANGVVNIPEFGSAKTPAGFDALRAMDGYLKIKDRVSYPAMLFMHGINDPRVEPWMSSKAVARVQAASTSGNPVLFRIDYDAGHGHGSTSDQINSAQADAFAFLLRRRETLAGGWLRCDGCALRKGQSDSTGCAGRRPAGCTEHYTYVIGAIENRSKRFLVDLRDRGSPAGLTTRAEVGSNEGRPCGTDSGSGQDLAAGRHPSSYVADRPHAEVSPRNGLARGNAVLETRAHERGRHRGADRLATASGDQAGLIARKRDHAPSRSSSCPGRVAPQPP